MGLIKRSMIDEESRGWRSSGQRFVCKSCITDEYLKDLVESEAESPCCDYCGARSLDGSPFGALLDVVLDPIVSALRFSYNHPAAELPYESAEGGFQGNVDSTRDLLDELDISDNTELLDDICGCIDQDEWCERNYFSLREEEVILGSWQEFCAAVKHRTRFLFLLPRDRAKHPEDYLTPARCLLAITDVLVRTESFRTLEAGSFIYRARLHREGETPRDALSLGPPLPCQARASNRLSPAGIPMFYGTFDEVTARAEVKASLAPNSELTRITCGRFELLKDTTVVDLATEMRLPSIFDEERRDLLPAAWFLRSFAQEASQPIKKDGREHVEYVPTQIVTEYLRHYVGKPSWVSEMLGPEPGVGTDKFDSVLRDLRKKWFEQTRVDGVMYRSAVAGGTCCGLFIEAKDCVDPQRRNDDVARLVLDPESLKTELV